MNTKKIIKDEDLNQHAYQIKSRGYTVLPNFLDFQQVQQLKQGIEIALKAYSPIKDIERSELDRYQIHDLICTNIDFAKLIEDARLQQIIELFLGPSWIMYAATSSSIPPHGKNYSSRLHIDSPRFYPGYIFNIGVIWTLDPYTVANGALRVLPGSQHVEDTPSFDFFEKNCVPIICDAGSLLVFNARMFHRTYQNDTNEWQHSMTLNACRSFMKQRMDWVRFIPSEIVTQLNGQAKRIIGFDTRLPVNLEEFFVPESKRLYKSGQG